MLEDDLSAGERRIVVHGCPYQSGGGSVTFIESES